LFWFDGVEKYNLQQMWYKYFCNFASSKNFLLKSQYNVWDKVHAFKRKLHLQFQKVARQRMANMLKVLNYLMKFFFGLIIAWCVFLFCRTIARASNNIYYCSSSIFPNFTSKLAMASWFYLASWLATTRTYIYKFFFDRCQQYLLIINN